MKTLFPILAVLLLVSCQKENSKTMAEALTTQQQLPLKAIPSAVVNGKTITFTADKSTGMITQYGWALDISSPTDGGNGNPITWSPNMSHKGSDFVPLSATVTKAGKYEFGLTVYDAKGQDYALISVEVQ